MTDDERLSPSHASPIESKSKHNYHKTHYKSLTSGRNLLVDHLCVGISRHSGEGQVTVGKGRVTQTSAELPLHLKTNKDD